MRIPLVALSTALAQTSVLVFTQVAPLGAQRSPIELGQPDTVWVVDDSIPHAGFRLRTAPWQRYSLTVESDTFDTVVKVMTEDRSFFENDDDGTSSNSAISFVTGEDLDGDGTVLVEVNVSSYFGDGIGPFRLTGRPGLTGESAVEHSGQWRGVTPKGEPFDSVGFDAEWTGSLHIRVDGEDHLFSLRRGDSLWIGPPFGIPRFEIGVPGSYTLYVIGPVEGAGEGYSFRRVGFPDQDPTSARGVLTETSPQMPTGERFAIERIEIHEDHELTVRLESVDFDAYLILRTPDGTIVAQNDDGPESLDSEISLSTAPLDNVTHLEAIVTTVGVNATGAWTLTWTHSELPGRDR